MSSLRDGVLPRHAYERAVQYVCYERHYYYLYAIRLGFDAFALFHLDRFLGWRFDAGPEPLLPLRNGFERFLDTHVRHSLRTATESLHRDLRDLFRQGHRVAANVWWAPHADNIAAVTSVLLEGMDDDGTLYFTKVNETRNRVCAPLTEEELLRRIAVDDDGWTTLTVIRDSDAVRELVSLPPREVLRRLLHDHYGYDLSPRGITSGGVPVRPDLAGIRDWIAYLRGAEADFIVDGAVPKHQQFLLNKSVRNAFTPVQQYLAYVAAPHGLGGWLPEPLVAAIVASRTRMERALDDIHKFASLLVQRPTSSFYAAYVDSARRLHDSLADYQQVHLDLLEAAVLPVSAEATP